MQLVRKISRDTVFGSKTDALELVMSDKGKPHPIYTVYGICNGSRVIDPEENDKTAGKGLKQSTALIGEFRAVNSKTGEMFASGVCYVPQYLADMILGQLSEEVHTVKFGFEMSIAFDEGSATSYVYQAALIGQPKESDAMKELETQVAAFVGKKQISHAKDGGAEKDKAKK